MNRSRPASVAELPIFPPSDAAFRHTLAPVSDLRVTTRRVAVATLADDRRIGMPPFFPHESRGRRAVGDLSFRMRGNHRRWRYLHDGICNVVLPDTKRSRVVCKRPQRTDALPSNCRVERSAKRIAGETARYLRCGAHMLWTFRRVDELLPLGRVDRNAPNAFDDDNNAVMIKLVANSDKLQGRRVEKSQLRGRLEMGASKISSPRTTRAALPSFCACVHRANPARTPHSGSLQRFGDLVEKLRNCKNKCKILRFLEI